MPEQRVEDLIKQYGGTMQPQPPPGPQQSPQTLDDLIKQYGGTLELGRSRDVLDAPASYWYTEPGARPGGSPVYTFPRPEGAPVYQPAPRLPEQPPTQPGGSFLQEAVVQPAKQLASGFMTGAAGASHLTANIAGLLDAAATQIANLTGTEKGGVFKHIENWARDAQRSQEQQAAELSGGRQDLASQLYRGGAAAVTSLPTYAVAAELGGPVGGMALLGAAETADQGWKAQLQAAAQGALAGKALQVMGPASRPIRLVGAGAMTYAQLRLQGVDHETALAQALTMGGLMAMHPGGAGVRDIAQNLPTPSLNLKSVLNPVQQGGVDYLRSEGVPLTAGQQTGNRYLQAMEQTTAHQPLGAVPAREFATGTQEAITGLSEKLAGEVHPEPTTPYEGGKAAGDVLDRQISELNLKANDAYKDAWQHAGKPQFTENVVIRREPVLDADGKPTGETKDIRGDVNMPVDVRWMKDIARQEIQKYEYGLSSSELSQSRAYSILKKILAGNDVITAEQAEEALKGLKAESREAESPDLRNAAQGTAARLIPDLQAGVNAAVAKTGQESLDGLLAGRKLHAQKMEIAELARKLREEPVQAFGQLTMARDSGIDYLKQIAARAPGVMPKLGRAYLENLFDMATAEGGWTRAAGVFRKWDQLGDQTKALLFPNASQRQALDRFFLATKTLGEPINPSGTALVKGAQEAGINPFKWAYGYVGGKLFFTPKGIKFLTGIAQNPPRTAAESAAVKAQAEKIFGPPEGPEEPPEGPPEGGEGPPPPSPPSGGEGGAAPPAGIGSLQERLQTLGDEAFDRVKNSGTFQGRTLPSLFPADVTKDMITWGAARIANGAIDFAKWSKAMLDDATDISPEAAARIRAMLPALYQDSKKEYEHHLQTIGAGNIADLPTIMKYYRAGKEGKNWYNFVKPALQPLFGENTDLFLRMFAATSPNTKVTQNVLNAVKAYRQFFMGEPFTGMPAHVDNLNRAVAGVKMSGPKVGAFGPNLLGNLTPVTVDLWMARAILGRDTVTPLQSKLVDYMTSQAAKKVGLQPAEMQAAIWTGIKKLMKSRDTSAPPEVIIKEYLDKNPETRKLFEDSLEMSKEHFKELQSKQAPAKPPRS